MMRYRLGRAATLALSVLAVLAVAWLLPPAIQKTLHYCPVRPDGVTEAGALPQFARRYGVDCSVCHTSVPQLTPTGYKFRAAGFRMPDEIGQDAKFNGWSNVTSVRIREKYTVSAASTKGAGNTKVPATNGFSFGTVDWWPIMGAIGKYWSMGTEVDFHPDAANTVPDLGNAYIKGVFPVNDDLFFTVRAGLMSAIEGYQASDRGIGGIVASSWKAKPSNTVNGNTFSEPAVGQNGQGLELGVSYKDTRATVQVTNGYNSNAGSTQLGEDNYLKDWNIFVNQFITDAASVSAFYSNNKAGYKYDGTAEANGTPNGAAWIDNYEHGAVYASYKFLPDDHFNVNGGMQVGRAHYIQTGTTDGSDTYNSWGWLVAAQSHIKDNLWAGVQVDTGRPSTRTGSNRSSDVVGTIAERWDNCRLYFDYGVKRIQSAVGHDQTTNTASLTWDLHF